MLEQMKTKLYLGATVLSLAPGKLFAGVTPTNCGAPGQTPCVQPVEGRTFSFTGLLNGITNLVFTVISVVALLAIVYGAFLYMTAGGDSEKTTKARNVIMYALLGVLIIALSYTLIRWAMGGDLLGWFGIGGK